MCLHMSKYHIVGDHMLRLICLPPHTITLGVKFMVEVGSNSLFL